ncbi:MAG: outer membrane beta-barrel protein [Gammaproteobacteria bacterium]|jgi:hypothetical protein|nr:outer membrane beta-barrel protein [Gammaproteobacteria bacterium]
MGFCKLYSHKFKLRLTIIIFFILFAPNAFAQGSFSRGLYLGGSFTRHSLKDVEFDGSLNGAVFKIGYDIASFFAIEGQIGGTIPEDYVIINEQGQIAGDYDVRSEHAGIFLRGNWRLRNVTLYGLLGYGYYNLIESEKIDGQSDVTYFTEESGLSYGIGVDLFGSRRTALSLNWMQLIKEETEFDFTLDVSSIYLGITYYFKPQKTTHALE